jgi:ABC-type transport system involved in multi-copper enzyme maturation permease subunit
MAAPTIPVQVPGTSRPGGHPSRSRAGLAGAIASEWTKIRTVRSTYWTLISLAIVSTGLGALVCAGNPGSPGTDATQVSLLIFAYAGPVIIAVLGALAITPEYSTGMIRVTLTAQPRRGTVYAAKVIVLAAVALAVSLVTAFAAFGAGQAMLSGQAMGLSHAGTLRAITGAALYVTATALIAFGLGTIVRNAAPRPGRRTASRWRGRSCLPSPRRPELRIMRSTSRRGASSP